MDNRDQRLGWAQGIQAAPSWAEFAKIQKRNKELLELVGELTLYDYTDKEFFLQISA